MIRRFDSDSIFEGGFGPMIVVLSLLSRAMIPRVVTSSCVGNFYHASLIVHVTFQ